MYELLCLSASGPFSIAGTSCFPSLGVWLSFELYRLAQLWCRWRGQSSFRPLMVSVYTGVLRNITVFTFCHRTSLTIYTKNPNSPPFFLASLIKLARRVLGDSWIHSSRSIAPFPSRSARLKIPLICFSANQSKPRE